MVEESKESIIRKNQELLRHLQDKDRQIQDVENEKADEIGHLRQDNADLTQQINHLNYLVNKLKSEIAEKDSMIGRSYNDNEYELNAVKQQLEMKKQENAQLSATVRDLRMTHKEYEGEWERKKRELAERCNMLEGEARKYKEEYQRIC